MPSNRTRPTPQQKLRVSRQTIKMLHATNQSLVQQVDALRTTLALANGEVKELKAKFQSAQAQSLLAERQQLAKGFAQLMESVAHGVGYILGEARL